MPSDIFSSSSCYIHQKVCRWQQGLQPYFVTVIELSLVAGRALPKNEFAYCMLLDYYDNDLCFTLENSTRQLSTANRSRVCIFLSNRRSSDRHAKFGYCFSLCACLSCSSRKFLARWIGACLTPRNIFPTQHIVLNLDTLSQSVWASVGGSKYLGTLGTVWYTRVL